VRVASPAPGGTGPAGTGGRYPPPLAGRVGPVRGATPCGTPADPSRQGRGRPPSRQGRGRPPPPLAGRVRPNSERVPRPWRDGFASLTGLPREGRVLRRIFVGSLSPRRGESGPTKIRALTRPARGGGRWGGASLTGKRPRPPYGGRDMGRRADLTKIL